MRNNPIHIPTVKKIFENFYPNACGFKKKLYLCNAFEKQKAFFLTVLTLRKISIRDGFLIQLKKSVIILAICRRQWILPIYVFSLPLFLQMKTG